jgi:predicted lactoylglutathione lyase
MRTRSICSAWAVEAVGGLERAETRESRATREVDRDLRPLLEIGELLERRGGDESAPWFGRLIAAVVVDTLSATDRSQNDWLRHHGANDLARAVSFYDTVLSELGASQLYSTNRMAAWGTSKNGSVLIVTLPYDEGSATEGNGVMVALAVKNREVVDAVYGKALELGATDEGQPGPRGTSAFYAGYFRDLDGNKTERVHLRLNLGT